MDVTCICKYFVSVELFVLFLRSVGNWMPWWKAKSERATYGGGWGRQPAQRRPTRQPSLLVRGTKSRVEQLFLQVEDVTLPPQTTNIINAFDALLKSYYVFNLAYPAPVHNWYLYLQTQIFGLDLQGVKCLHESENLAWQYVLVLRSTSKSEWIFEMNKNDKTSRSSNSVTVNSFSRQHGKGSRPKVPKCVLHQDSHTHYLVTSSED